MKKKNYKGRVDKRVLPKCEEVCRTYSDIAYAYATTLSESEEVKSFRTNVALDGISLNEAYTSDFVVKKMDGSIIIRECVERSKLTKPLTCKLLDASRNYWLSHGISDWGIVIDKEEPNE